ncbi:MULTISPECIES: response regulator transcription factor [Aneurinibacillus]|jgi:two-component system response regulator YesN|uniref:DNA-binding response regulator n=1 Tax=Aneurinibacillus danicus TaxID=267746 RepID=A0A511V766_9BACL|nr:MULTISPECIES: response regulator [Aneurinibacillus]GEN34774.1 hypothetical protein ADA01nite_22340 [Aneurinibacillus danicus]
MLKVLIVDDELIVRKGLRAYVNWKAYDMEVVSEAANGEQALEIINQQPIELVITDIRMPLVDGIELTRAVKENYPHITVILLTCYDDFSLVKEALDIGASGYVLKTELEDGSFESILKKTSKEWKKRQKEGEYYKRLEKEAENSRLLLREKQVQSMLEDPSSSIPDELDWIENGFVGIYFEFLCSPNSFVEVEKQFYAIASKDKGVFLPLDDYRAIGLFAREKEYSEMKRTTYEQEQCRKLFGKITKIAGEINIYYCASSTNDKAGHVLRSLKEKGAYHTFYNEFGHLLDVHSIPQQGISDPFAKMDWQELRQLTLMRDWARIKDICDELFSHLAIEKPPVEDVKKVVLEIILIITHGLQTNSNLLTLTWGSNRFDNIELAKKKRTYKQLIEWLYEGINELEDSRSVFIGGINSVISKAISYMERNYMLEITLEDVAEHVGLSKSYFSSRFKKITGENFIDYLISLRIKKAKQLLQETDLKILEVAEKVGFNDPRYFAKLFKRFEGVGPKQFQESVHLYDAYK